jgi:iron complex transport system permease protein
MGSLSSITIDRVKCVFPIVIILTLLMYMLSWRLNIFSFGEEEAKSLGINTERLRITIIVCASLLTATIVSVTGLIGWVGLIIPHAARFLIGPNHRVLIPASFLLGAAFLLLVDDLARSVSSLEIPLGVITSIIGAPLFFVILLSSSKKMW